MKPGGVQFAMHGMSNIKHNCLWENLMDETKTELPDPQFDNSVHCKVSEKYPKGTNKDIFGYHSIL